MKKNVAIPQPCGRGENIFKKIDIKKMTISFRPHHFLCALCFVGKGYSSKFTLNFEKTLNYLKSNPAEKCIEVVTQTDTICSPCPHKRDKLCATQEKVTALDQSHATILNLNKGDKLSWNETQERLKKMTIPKFNSACAACEWKPSGICEKQLIKFRDQIS